MVLSNILKLHYFVWLRSPVYMEHFPYPMAHKLLNYTIFEFICMIPSKFEIFSQVVRLKK